MNDPMARATGLEARFEEELAGEVPGWRKWGKSDPVAGRPEATACVRHNVARQRFELESEAGLAVAEYELADGRMIVTHTFVPPEARGKGLAERVVAAALKHARAEGLRVVPQCSYVETFFRRHPEFADLRAEQG
jgi:predicted GNAT family acetyltransferase